MMNLDFQTFKALASTHNLIPLYADMSADLETPVSAFLKLRTGKYDFLFESVVGGEKWGRYSFIGIQPKSVYRFSEGAVTQWFASDDHTQSVAYAKSPFEPLRTELKALKIYQDSSLPRFWGGWVGFLAYDMIRNFESIKLSNAKEFAVPDYLLLETDTVVIFDNFSQKLKIVVPVRIAENSGDDFELNRLYQFAEKRIAEIQQKLSLPLPQISPTTIAKNVAVKRVFDQSAYCDMVNKAKEYIKAGDVFQVVLSNRFTMERGTLEPIDVYRELRRLNPSPYMFYLGMDDHAIVGASPEILVRLERGEITVRPIAGTRPRGMDDVKDRELEVELLSDPKELAEHVMLVDLGRNDVGRVAKTGSVKVSAQHVIERYSHVMHLVSHVTGQLAEGCDAFDVVAATFPAGTLSGAPKIRAMQIIEELEPVARGVYGGAVGYFGYSGDCDFAITIRSALFTQEKISVQAGAGIVFDSVPESEFQECESKARAMLKAIGVA